MKVGKDVKTDKPVVTVAEGEEVIVVVGNVQLRITNLPKKVHVSSSRSLVDLYPSHVGPGWINFFIPKEG